MLTKRVIEFRATARIHLNGDVYHLAGSGQINDREGIVEGRYNHDVPSDDVDALIFQTVLITGYPSVCAGRPGLHNPFHGHDYRYTRSVDFGPHGRISYSANCWHVPTSDGLTLHSTFDVEGNLKTGRLEPATEVSETWTPINDQIHSEFAIEWRHRDQRATLRGNANTVYELPEAISLASPMERQIVFPHACSKDQQLSVIQRSWLS